MMQSLMPDINAVAGHEKGQVFSLNRRRMGRAAALNQTVHRRNEKPGIDFFAQGNAKHVAVQPAPKAGAGNAEALLQLPAMRLPQRFPEPGRAQHHGLGDINVQFFLEGFFSAAAIVPSCAQSPYSVPV